jgi:P4 family phage/plasmid primase-like protien
MGNDDVNQYPVHWINFKNGMLDTMTGQMYPHDPKYYAINQIPHEYNPEAVFDGTVADRFFRGIMPDDDDRNMFFAYAGYCMTIDTRLQKFLVLLGAPGTGKSTANNIISDMIGRENISGMPMQDLNERFMPTVLLGKLLNVCSDIPGTSMDQTSAIKLITGEDPVKGEYKHGNIFTFRNYAKLLFSANEMPAVLSENPEAFYRRVIVIEITHKGPEIRNLREGLKASIPGLIVKCVQELQKHYILSIPLDSPNSKVTVEMLKTESDSVRGFFEECLEQDPHGRISQPILYDRYQAYCWANQWRPKSKSRLFAAFRSMGYDSRKSNGVRVFCGVSFKVEKGT